MVCGGPMRRRPGWLRRFAGDLLRFGRVFLVRLWSGMREFWSGINACKELWVLVVRVVRVRIYLWKRKRLSGARDTRARTRGKTIHARNRKKFFCRVFTLNL
jgi:hypothetical protein